MNIINHCDFFLLKVTDATLKEASHFHILKMQDFSKLR
jgi:hypothetical protein